MRSSHVRACASNDTGVSAASVPYSATGQARVTFLRTGHAAPSGGWRVPHAIVLYSLGLSVVSTTKCSKLNHYWSVLQELDPSVVADATTCVLQYQELDPNAGADPGVVAGCTTHPFKT